VFVLGIIKLTRPELAQQRPHRSRCADALERHYGTLERELGAASGSSARSRSSTSR
jgi:hypothetical protein